MTQKDQWYNNKELFEMFTKSVKELSEEMDETKERLHQYNGLHDRFDNVEGKLGDIDDRLIKQVKRCDEVQGVKAGKGDVYQGLLKLWPILISTAMAIFTIWFTTK